MDVPSLIDVVLHPERRRPSPEPLAVSLRPPVRVGIGLWLIALGVTSTLWWIGFAPSSAVWTCGAGVVLGSIGLALLHRRGWR